MSRMLVTGGAGFIGSHLIDALIKEGHEVTVIDNFHSGNRHNLNPAASLIELDIRKLNNKDNSFDVIFHLAAMARIQPSFTHPVDTYEINSTGTLNILELARFCKAKVIYAGSSTAYFDVFANPYAYCKWLGEQHCLLYSKLYGVSTVIGRFFNVYGPRQLEEGVYSTVVGIFERCFRNKEPLPITGTGDQVRDFTHVSDIVQGLVLMSKNQWQGEVFELGTGRGYSINTLAKMFKTETVYIPKRPGEAPATLADITKSKEELGYEPVVSLESYIKELVLHKA
jgi:UDP-glucose 4-epimerase